MNKYTLKAFFAILLGTINLISMATVPIKTDKKSNFKVEFDSSFENTIYPSLILGLSSYSAKINESFGLLNYTFAPQANACTMKVKLEQSTVNKPTIFQEALLTSNNETQFSPMINWDYESLKNMSNPGNVDLAFSCFLNNTEIDNKNLRLNYRSVNECIYGIINEDGTYSDLKWMFGAYVNEEHPKIDYILQDALKTGLVNSFMGYQQNSEKSVIKQIFALWYLLQSKGVKYSSITATSNTSKKVFSQYVRFFDEVYDKTQANCVDGSVFLSSILKKIEIKPILVLVPGHMYMGFYTSADKSSYQLLETTMVGEVNLAEIYQDELYVYGLEKYSHLISSESYTNYQQNLVTLEQLKVEISWNSFQNAISCRIDDYNAHLNDFSAPENYSYQLLDLDDIRQLVKPIGR